MAHVNPGKILIVAGGTGIYPFCDLLDLLYKEQLMKEKPQLRDEILELSPVLKDDPFKDFTFELIAAFRHFQDIHVITLEQLLYLAEKGRLKVTLKLKGDLEGVPENHSMGETNESFEKLVVKKAEE